MCYSVPKPKLIKCTIHTPTHTHMHTPTHTHPHTHTHSIPESTSMSQDFIRGKHSGIKKKQKRQRRYFNRHKNSSQSLAKLSNSDQNLARGGQGSLVSMRGRSRSQLSLGRAPSMTQLVEEPRRATSTTSQYTSQDI